MTISAQTTFVGETSIVERTALGGCSPVDDEALFRSLFENSGLGMASLGPDLAVHDANPEFARVLDHKPENVLGRNFFEFLHPGSHPLFRKHFERLTDGRRTSFTDRMVAVRPCSTVFTGELTGVAVRNGAQRAAAVMVLVRPGRGGEAEGASTELANAKSGRGCVLTELDARILEGIAKGMSTVQLATQLYLSRQGVEYHVTTMLRRLKAPNRAALVSRAYAAGVLGLGSWPPRVLPEAVRPVRGANG
ncbi:LuxR C-terminal-related transcriptional regulator [Sciscionella sediminilitoris]|uniref:LuxR C-terminal-related transcriptional regulator n=1 Tax=Sciscionella sediminilitoris TaxID=1445613 RepID=UPI000B00E1CC|nr:LuxR C-terminal-related transcriptional regulator [Sciscionella sp. SE31]